MWGEAALRLGPPLRALYISPSYRREIPGKKVYVIPRSRFELFVQEISGYLEYESQGPGVWAREEWMFHTLGYIQPSKDQYGPVSGTWPEAGRAQLA